MELVLVGFGGFFGGLSRYWVGRAVSARARPGFPLGTFLINLSGALLLGILTGLRPGESALLLLGDGFLGAFTTFSTFMFEGVGLLQGRKRLSALVYIGATLLLGIAGFLCGFQLGVLLGA